MQEFITGLFYVFLVAMLISLAITAFTILIIWKIFKKAGKPGWAVLVPVYNLYTLFEITWGNGWLFLIPLVCTIPLKLPFGIILAEFIVIVVLTIMTNIKLARAFGKGTVFGIGLIFLSIIFMAILAFDSSEYLGVEKNDSPPVNPEDNNENVAPISAAAVVDTPIHPTQPSLTISANNIGSIQAQVPQNNIVTEPQQPINPTTPVSTQQGVNQNLVTCPNCTTQLQPGTQVCPNCGTRIIN